MKSFTCHKIDQNFCLTCVVASDVILFSCNLASECAARCYFSAALYCLLLHLLLLVSVGGSWCGHGRVDKEVPQSLWPSKGYQRWVEGGLFQLLRGV